MPGTAIAEPFGEMLRRHRLAASLTQEALAERAAISATAIGALERGRRRAPRLSTVRQIARALDLDAGDLAELARAASSESTAGETADAAASPGAGNLASGPVLAPARDVAGGRSAPGPHARRWRSRFVGRGDELGALAAAWSAHRRLVVVTGEAGIGKTRLVSEFAAQLSDSGVTVCWGRCSEEPLGAYLPFVEITRQLVGQADPDRLVAALGARGELTRLVPELEHRIGPLVAPTQAEAGTEQRLLFESVAALLALFMPLVVVLDDLHWADDAAIALLRYLAGAWDLDAFMMVATAREVDLAPGAAGRLADLGRQVEVGRVRLGALGEEALGDLVVDLVGTAVAADVVASVVAATDGNPFFVEEMTVHLLDSGLIVETGELAGLEGSVAAAGVPDRVKEMLTRRLLSLPSDALDLLLTGSIIGREFDLSVAAAASSLEGPRLVDAADDGLLSGLVSETGPGRLAFSHALVQHAVADRLSYARAASIHRAVAQALEARAEARPELAADLARHWAKVAEVDPAATTTAATWAVTAGDLALASAAADEAIARYEQASTLWSSATRGHADALVRLGSALAHRGRADEADGRFREALQIARGLHDAPLEARAAIGLGRRYPYWESDSDRIDVLERALTSLGGDEPLLRLMLMGLLVTQMINGFREDEAQRRDECADHLAAVADDPGTPDEVLLSLGQIRLYDCIEDPVRLQRVAARLASVAEARNELRVLAVATLSAALSALDRAEMVSLRSTCERHGAVADALGDPRERSQAATVRATIAFIEGRYGDSDALSAEAHELGKSSGDYNSDLVFYAGGLLRAVDRGQAAEVLPLLVAASDYQQIGSFSAGTALCAALASEDALASEYLERLVGAGLQGSPRGADRLAPTAFLAHTCALLDAKDHAAALYDALTSQAAIAVRVGPLIGWWGPVGHHVGSLLRLLGDLEGAESHLNSALVIEESMGARPFRVRTRGELARVLRLSGREDEAAGVAALALAEAELLGAPGLAAEVLR